MGLCLQLFFHPLIFIRSVDSNHMHANICFVAYIILFFNILFILIFLYLFQYSVFSVFVLFRAFYERGPSFLLFITFPLSFQCVTSELCINVSVSVVQMGLMTGCWFQLQ